MADVAPIDRPSTSELVAAGVRRRIWAGELASGSRLNQDDLAAAFGVSRIPVREALIALAHEGVVRMEPHRGAFVEPLDGASVRDHYELYALLDGFAIRKLDARVDAATRARLADALRATAAIHDDAELFAHVTATRARIHDLGGSPRFTAVANGLVGLVPGNFFAEVAGTAELARSGLAATGAAIAAGDPDAAAAAYTEMLIAQGELVIELLRARGVLASPTDDPNSREETP
jgi:DNA-binding GntR family transcriptional regulator